LIQGKSRRTPLLLVVISLAAIVAGCFGDPDAPAAAVDSTDIAIRDFPFGEPGSRELGGGSGPTGQKPQSKLWFNDGSWWGVLFDRSVGEYRIHSYGWDTRTWTDTGTLVDKRDRSRADALWDGEHLYVASAASNSASPYASVRLTRYSYDAALGSYLVDKGFPIAVSDGGTETVVLAKDTAGELWVTYTQEGRVYANRSLGDDLDWGEPFVLPTPGTTVSPDDISSVVAFGGKIGVMWSNQTEDAFYFATHKDGEPDEAWHSEVVLQGPNVADDHVSLKADSEGRVYAAVKTSLNDLPDKDPDAPLALLLVRSSDGGWDRHTFGRVGDRHTKPMVLIDEQRGDLYVFATSPCCDGGKIYYKRTSLNEVTFPEGRGMPFIESADDSHINDVTSTKQDLGGTEGLLVEASDKASGYYLQGALEAGAMEASTGSVVDEGQADQASPEAVTREREP
jgi:hypothetical protein